MAKPVERITILGGGTAGWLTALLLSHYLKTGSPDATHRITLIESPNIPTVGVGEEVRPVLVARDPASLLESGQLAPNGLTRNAGDVRDARRAGARALRGHVGGLDPKLPAVRRIRRSAKQLLPRDRQGPAALLASGLWWSVVA